MKNSALTNSTKTTVSIAMIVWLLLTGVLAYTGFYQDTTTIPPKILSAFVPLFVLMFVLFLSKKGRAFIDHLSLEHLTWVNIVRIPVEFCLYWLALNKAVPELMSFAGRNFDIIAGITAPFIIFLVFRKQILGRTGAVKLLLIWNVIMLGFLIFIVVNGLLSAPLPFQQFAFDQPNIALAYFPFIWLPGFIVPVVMFGHFVSIRQLIMSK